MANNIGIMQSRLSPITELNNKYQAFPEKTWEEEFELAHHFGYEYIEWIYDGNPKNVLRNGGVMDVLRTGMDNRVYVKAICADYFIKENFTSGNPSKAIAELNNLIMQAFKLGVRNIVLPCLEESSLQTLDEISLFAKNIQPCLDYAVQYWVNLCIESDLNPDEVEFLLVQAHSSKLKICYDTGNSAFLGYNVADEFKAYGEHIAHVHLKDRKKGGPNTEIGTGDCDFSSVFSNLHKVGYQGFMTLQCARAENLAQLNFTDKQFHTIKSILESRCYGTHE